MKEKTLKELDTISTIAELQLQRNIITISEYASIILYIHNRFREVNNRGINNNFNMPDLTQPLETINVISLVDAIVFSN